MALVGNPASKIVSFVALSETCWYREVKTSFISETTKSERR